MNPSDLPAGLAVGRYVIERPLGAGGMGVVYVARHPELQHSRVAIKVLAARFAGDAQLVARFHGEAQAASRIGHPNIISVLDRGQLSDGRPYLVMELLDGEGLDALLDRAAGPLGFAAGARIFDQLCLGLAAAHQAGIVHRDLKPENVFVVKPRHAGADELYVKILDFGIAKPLDAAATLTGTGEVLGTPYYMSPEQCRGQPVDARSDIYALGVMLYESFTGQRPFAGTSGADLLVKHILEQARPPRELGLTSLALERLILDCMAKAPADRPATVAQVRTRLLAALAMPGPDLARAATVASVVASSATWAGAATAAPMATRPAADDRPGTSPPTAPVVAPVLAPGVAPLVVRRTRWFVVPAVAVALAAVAGLWIWRSGGPAVLPAPAAVTTPAPALPASVPVSPPGAPPSAAQAEPPAPSAVKPPRPRPVRPRPAASPGSGARAADPAAPPPAPRELSPAEQMGLIPQMNTAQPAGKAGVR